MYELELYLKQTTDIISEESWQDVHSEYYEHYDDHVDTPVAHT